MLPCLVKYWICSTIYKYIQYPKRIFFWKRKSNSPCHFKYNRRLSKINTINKSITNSYKKKYRIALAFVVQVNIISELTSILILIFFIPKGFKITKQDLKLNKKNIKKVLSIGLPTTGSRLIGTIGFFLEPIILTYTLTKLGYSNKYIINEYGIISGYIIPLVLLPSFLTLAISEALVPNISKYYTKKKYKTALKRIKQGIFFSLLIGLPATIFLELYPEIPMKIIYNTKEGITYLKILAPVALMHHIQSPLTASLQAMGKAKEAMKGTLEGTIIRTLSLLIFPLLNIGIWSLVIAISFNIIYVTIHQYKEVIKALKKDPKIFVRN